MAVIESDCCDKHAGNSHFRVSPTKRSPSAHLQRRSEEGEPALIFEDDTRLFAPASEFHSAVAKAPEGWDLIHFHGPAHYDGIVERTEGHTARALQTVGFGAVAYAVSPAGIYKIMRAAYPPRLTHRCHDP